VSQPRPHDASVTLTRSPGPSTSTGLRTGADYLDSIRRDGRRVYLNGELVKDVTAHPAFRRAAESLASLYDLCADPANRDLMTFPSPSTGQPVLRAYQVARQPSELVERRRFHERWAETTFGLMGRTPDHVAAFLCGYAAKPSVFAAAGQQYAANVVRFYEHARDAHLYLTYAIVPPQIDRSKPAHRQADPTLYAGVVGERDGGIVLRGAQQLATAAVFSDYIYISCIHPLQPGDENYAFAVAVPVNADGLKLYSRRAFAREGDSVFDYPLTSRYDESDSLVVLDDVYVPWERVFIYRNIELCRDQWYRTPAHSLGNYQAQVRYATKLRFMLGLAKRMTEMTGVDSQPPVQVQLGELAAIASIYESMIQAQEVQAAVDSEGAVWPGRAALYAAMSLQSELNGRVVETIRELTGSAMICLPSAVEDYENPETAADIERYITSAGVASRERVALMKLAWDAIGTEFAGRHQQYEKFYGGAPAIVKQTMYRTYAFDRAKALVERALAASREDLTTRLGK
jgi:4-hydroxyphenylacetate 3-monooxygenase